VPIKRFTVMTTAVVVLLAVQFFGRGQPPLVDQSASLEPPRDEQPSVATPGAVSSNLDKGAVQTPTDAISFVPGAPAEPEYVGPAEVENALLQLLAQQPRLALVSVNSVKCSATTCEIAYSGAGPDASAVSPGAMEILDSLFAKRWAEVRVLSSGVGTREIVPGARETVFSFEYQPLVDLSDDPSIAARQQARCSAAWVRQTTNPTPDDVVRQYLEIAQQRLALASAVLGEEEAERIAARTHGGPLIRECGLTPW
jgi:hypothetical protein